MKLPAKANTKRINQYFRKYLLSESTLFRICQTAATRNRKANRIWRTIAPAFDASKNSQIPVKDNPMKIDASKLPSNARWENIKKTIRQDGHVF